MAGLTWVELHARSAFSWLRGASTPERMAARANELGSSTMALTDRDDVGGVIRFAEACGPLRPIVGAEVSLGPGCVVLLCENEKGWSNLTQMITRARANGPLGLEHVLPEGLICLTGGREGTLERSADRAGTLSALRERFEGRCFVEVSDHQAAGDVDRVRAMIELAESAGLPWVVTGDACYASRADKPTHDVLTCLRHECTLDEAGSRLFTNDARHLVGPVEMARRWDRRPEGIVQSLAIAERCGFRILEHLHPSLPAFSLPDREVDVDEWVEHHAFRGLQERYGRPSDRHVAQLRRELSLVRRLGLAGYFAIVHDIVRFARHRNILVQGRGSAANSVLCYCLGITAVDPIGLDLLFERFLSESRSEPPDIDIDIAHHDRETVIQYVYQRFGRRHAAMVCTTVNWRAKTAVRDAARVLGLSTEVGDRLARQVGHLVPSDAASDRAFTDGKSASEVLREKGLEQAGVDARSPRIAALLHVVDGLEGLPKHRATHCGGFVMTHAPLDHVVPVQASNTPGRSIVQWDKYDLQPLGMVKLDLLGLGILTVLRDAFDSIRKHRGHEVGLDALPVGDPDTYSMIREADTIGVFQVESRTQMGVLTQTRPDSFFDLAVQVALVQPGPIQGNMVRPYLRRRAGLEPVRFLHPDLEPTLASTLGIPIFQEQVMKVAVTMAGFTPSQADELRRAMGARSENPAMREMARALRIGMAERGIEADTAERIVGQLAAFAHHGFPQSHAASFASLVYASAYLKRHYPVETTCALLNAQPMGFYGEGTIIMDARRRGVRILAPDINASDWTHRVEEREARFAVRLGLGLIRGLGPRAEASFRRGLDERPFRNVEHVADATGFRREVLRRLARAGALDSLVGDRRQALWEVMRLARRRRGPFDLPSKDPHVAPLRPPNEVESTLSDFASMRISVPHPMALLRRRRASEGLPSLDAVRGLPEGPIRVAGMLASAQRPATAGGFVFMAIEDETGLADVIVDPATFEQAYPVMIGSPILYIDGTLRKEAMGSRIVARRFERMGPSDLARGEDDCYQCRPDPGD